MVELLIYDSAHTQYKARSDGTIPPGADLIRFGQVVSMLRESLPDYLLVRSLMDLNRDNFGGLEKFLSGMLSNGHDKTNPKNFVRGLSADQIRALTENGYKGTDVIWAKPILRDSKPQPYDKANWDENTTAYLVFDGRAYVELFHLVYGQRDEVRRREGLLAVVFFVRDNKMPQPRDDLRFQLGSELDGSVIAQIQQKGYLT